MNNKINGLTAEELQNPVNLLSTVNETSTNKSKERQYRKMFMQLTCEDYFLIEQIAHQQKTTPYRIASAVVKLWLHKQLVRVVPENSPQNPPSE
jgi:transcriptional antiterminator